jgi:hypothetical protein
LNIAQTTASKAWPKVFAVAACLILVVGIGTTVRSSIVTLNCPVDTVAGDYLDILKMASTVNEGHYQWLQIIGDSFLNGHCLLVPNLIFLANALLGGWNHQNIIIVGLICNLLRCAFMVGALTYKANDRGPQLAAAIGVSMALAFGVSQMSNMAYPYGAISWAISLTAFFAGLCALVRGKSSIWGAVGFLLGGLACSFSLGNAAVLWLTYLLCVVINQGKRPLYYAFWLLGTVASLGSYAYAATKLHSMDLTYPHLPSARFVLDELGRIFIDNIGHGLGPSHLSMSIGAGGLVAAGILIVLNWKRKVPLADLTGPLGMIFYGVVSLTFVSIVRNSLAPWYTAFSISFWFGLVGLSLSMLSAPAASRAASPATSRAASPATSPAASPEASPVASPVASPEASIATKNGPDKQWPFVIASCLLMAFGAAHILDNLHWKDKDYFTGFHLWSSEAALRNYRTAPTNCIDAVLLPSNPGILERAYLMGYLLEKNHWLCFRPEQVWRLQGEIDLGNVEIKPDKKGQVYWVQKGRINKPQDPQSADCLDLVLAPGAELSWTVQLPANLVQATLVSGLITGPDLATAATVGTVEVKDKANDKGEFKENVKANNKIETKVEESNSQVMSAPNWQKDLLKLAPAAAVITMRNNDLAHPLCLKHPLILIKQGALAAKVAVSAAPPQPINTDLSSRFVDLKCGDLLLFPCRSAAITYIKKPAAKVIAYSADGVTIAPNGDAPLIVCPQAQHFNLADYKQFVLEIGGGGQPLIARAAFVQMYSEDGRKVEFAIPLLPVLAGDKQTHKYCFNLDRVREQSGDFRVASINLLPFYLQPPVEPLVVKRFGFSKR